MTHVKALATPKTYNFKKDDIVMVDSQGGSLGTVTKYNNVTQGFIVSVWDTEYATLNNPYAANPYNKYLKFIAHD